MSSEETVNYIIKSKCSVSRFGDGEVYVMSGSKNGFQDKNKHLASHLKNVAKNSDILVCIPNIFNIKKLCETHTKESYKFWKTQVKYRKHLYYKFFVKNRGCNEYLFGDSLFTRFYMNKKDKENSEGMEAYVEFLKKIWDQRDIVFIEGENSKLGVGNDLFDNAKSIKRILAPSLNAFNKFDDIVDFTESNIDKNSLILIALGQTASVLAPKLASNCFQAIDIGHIDIEYEWMKLKAINKVPISGKHTNECNYMGNNSADDGGIYLSQVIKIF